MRKLIWKEWHEQSWKLAFGCIVLGALALIGLHTRIVADENIMLWVCVLGFTLLPILSSTGLIPAERAQGSFESLLAMPIQPWRILAAKTAIGLLLCAGPMLLAAAISLIIAGGRELDRVSIMALYGRSILVSISLFVWMMALTARLPGEARAGLVAVGICVCWMLATVALVRPAVPSFLLATSPFAYIRTWTQADATNLAEQGAIDAREGSLFIASLRVHLLILAGLWLFTLRFFASSSNREE